MLLVRKRGTAAFMQPGGKRDPGEDDVTALARELDEELGCRVVPETFAALGMFECVGGERAGPPGAMPRSMRSMSPARSWRAPRSTRSLWIDPSAPPDIHLAPLTRDHVLPLAAARMRS